MVAKIKQYTSDVVKEMKKVSWPSKAQLKESTIVVIATTLVITGFVKVIDIGMELVVNVIF
ncbi:MAG: preprotein translocase subunit SecE [Candidatus Kapabacteria bacterium]|nr:preprotein translocase subunit SecE [Candidatus Kapabacteria bacterium]